MYLVVNGRQSNLIFRADLTLKLECFTTKVFNFDKEKSQNIFVSKLK